MIDLKARKEMAILVRRFATGRITNFEFEENIPVSNDPAVLMAENYIWALYPDHKERFLDKNGITKSLKCEIARIVLFLWSDLTFEWPSKGSHILDLMFKFSLGVIGKPRYPMDFGFYNAGDVGVGLS